MTREEILNEFRKASDDKSLQAIYVKLLRANHPDKGGSTETCQLINALYDDFRKAPKFNYDWSSEKPDYTEVSPELFEHIMAVSMYDALDVELCGTWLWITGETRTYSSHLKAAGFRWSPKKTAWYWHAEGYHKRSKKNFSLEEIRLMHGSAKINAAQYRKAAIA